MIGVVVDDAEAQHSTAEKLKMFQLS